MAFNTFSNHPVIRREQSYVLDRKMVSFHSEDRDIKKWPNSNRFEVRLPETIKNVQSIRLATISLPNNMYVFTNNYQNTKLTFKITTGGDYDHANNNVQNKLDANAANNYTITIDEGCYTTEQMANMLTNKMNDAVTAFLATSGSGDLQSVTYAYNHFKVVYNSVKKNFWFGNNFDEFSITSGTKITYTVTDCEQKVVWDQYTKWGLPYYLGLTKTTHASTTHTSSSGYRFDYETTAWLTPNTTNSNNKVFHVEGPKCSNIVGESELYIELDKFNSLSEIVPYSEATNQMYNNDYRGLVNGAFAKIPIKNDSSFSIIAGSNGDLGNILTHFTTPVEGIQKLLFKVRFHDGRMVDFKDSNFSFLIEFNCLLDEPAKQYNLRIPAVLGL